jgi:P-type conjugative transfer protein TrbJ
MAKNLERVDFPEIARLKSSMERVDQLMGQARGIDFRIDQLDRNFRTLFPGAVDDALRSDRRLADARARLETALDGIRHSMSVQAQVAGNVREDFSLLAELARRSQESEGSLQAQQAASQLLALSTKQQLQLQALLAAEFRSLALERAQLAQARSDGRAAARRFLGSGRAYTPQ